MMKRARESWRGAMLGVAVAAGAAMLGLTLAPRPVAAAIADLQECGEYGCQRCVGEYACGPGPRECCDPGNGGTRRCSTMCDIIIGG